MRETSRSSTWASLARTAALGVGVLMLAGCATGYSFVQPDVAGAGGYYTGDGPYLGGRDYDSYGSGPYDPGTRGYGYYNGARPYGSPYGDYGRGYGDGYGSQWIFNFGVSNLWNFPGYWRPWYTTGFPRWGCYSWRCGGHDYRRHRGRHHEGPWPRADNPSIPSPVADAAPQSADELARRQRLRELSALRHDRYVRNPRRPAGRSFVSTPMPLATFIPARARDESSIAGRPIRSGAAAMTVGMPRPLSRAAGATPQSPTRRAQPVRAAQPVAPSRPRRDGTPDTRIQ